MKRILVGTLAVLTLAACGGGAPTSLEGQWTLISYGSAADQIAAVPDVDASIEFDSEGRMTGNVGCNGFGGEYEIAGNTIIFSPIETTLMFCEGPVGDQELATLAVLQESATFVIDGGILTITSGDGTSTIVLERK